MRIATRLRLAAALVLLSSALILGVLVAGFATVTSAVERGSDITLAMNDIFELSMLTTDYLITAEPRAEVQWFRKHAGLGARLEALRTAAPADATSVSRLKEAHGSARELFEEIVQTRRSEALDAAKEDALLEHRARLAGRLLVVMQTMVSDSKQMNDRANDEILALRGRMVAEVIGISLFGLVLVTMSAARTTRAVIVPLDRIRDSAAAVGRGHLDVATGVVSPDEFGEAAAAFDGMVADLRRSYRMLQEEITVRRRAEEEVSDYRDHLEQLVEMRTEELVALNVELQEATRAKDEFLASMSHELRTPLNSIIGFTDLMLKGLAGETTEEQRRQLLMVHRAGKQLLALINDLLDLARLDASRLDITLAPMDPSETIAVLLETMRPAADERQIALSWRSEPGVPRFISTDSGKFEQIILNLLSNAVKFTDQGSVEVVVRPAGEGAFAVDVRDTGIGIAADELPMVFQRFHQADRERAIRYGGTGLGLAISTRIAEALGGTLTAESEPGTGSVFTLTLPVDGPGALAADASMESAVSGDSAGDSG